MKRYLKVFLLLFVALFSVTVYAEETNCIGGPEGTNCGDISAPIVISPSDTKSTDKQFYADDTVTITEDIDNTAFVAGNDVDVNSNIDGIGFIAGKNVKVKGSADYGFYAGYDVKVTDNDITDAFIAGNNITLTNVDGRTVYAAASTIKITDSTIDKLFLAGSTVTLVGDFDDVVVDAGTVIIEGTIYGTLEVNENAVIERKGETQIEKIITYKETEKNKEFSKGNKYAALAMAFVTSFFISYVNLAIVGAILIYACKKAFDKLAKNKNDVGYLFSKIGVGLCVLIVTPIAALILLLTGLASYLSFIVIFSYVIALMVTTPVVTVHYSNIFLKSIKNEYVRYFAGLLILQLVKKLPVIGGVVTFLTLCLGLGLIKDMLAKEKKEK